MNVLSYILGRIYGYASGAASKVISSLSVTENGTYTAEGNNGYSPVTVNVTDWELIGTQDITINTTGTSETEVGTIACNIANVTEQDIIYVHIRDKAGARAGYQYGSDMIISNVAKTWEEPASTISSGIFTIYVKSSGEYGCLGGRTAGVYAKSYDAGTGNIVVYSKYSSSYGTIDGTFKCDAYRLRLKSGMSMFEEVDV